MITAIVRYQLPASIDHDACLAHFVKIAPGIAGGVYQWRTRADADAFYSGPWRKGIVERYGMEPEIEFFDVFAITDNAAGTVKVVGEPHKSVA
jgi:hypothetical protein